MARLVHPRDGHPKVLVMIEAYFDESGIHSQATMCVVAGYWASPNVWGKFSGTWSALLKRFEVPLAEFHAKDIVPKPCGFFAKWDKDKHSDFIWKVAGIINQSVKIHPLTAGIVVGDFNSFSHDQRRFFTGAALKNGKLVTSGCPSKPYFVPFQHCIMQAACYAPKGSKAHFFFGLDRPFAGYATQLFKEIKANPLQVNCKERLGMPAFPLAAETPALQASDFLVHLTYQHMTENLEKNKLGSAHPAPLLQACLENGKASEDFIFFDRDVLNQRLEQTHALSGAWDAAPRKGVT